MIWVKIILVLASILYPSLIRAQLTSSADFLKLGPGARAQGMAGSFTAVSDDATSVYWNPGGLGFVKRQEIVLNRLRYMEDTSLNRFFYSLPFHSLLTSGLEISHLNSSGIPAFDVSGKPIEYINTGALVLNAGLGYEFLKDTASAGINFKYIYEKLASRTARAFAADAGFLIKQDISGTRRPLDILDGWRAGVSVKNLGTGMEYFSKKESLPVIFSGGAGLELFSRDLLIALQTDIPSRGNVAVSGGLEYNFLDMLAIRAGWREKPFSARDADRGIRTGIGLKNDRVSLDYAYSPYKDLGPAHRLTFSLKFGSRYRENLVKENTEKHFLASKKMYRNADLIGAREKLDYILEIDSDKDRALEWRMKIKEEINKVYYREIEDHLTAGESYLEERQLIEAHEEFLKVLGIDRSNTRALNNLRRINYIIRNWLEHPRLDNVEARKLEKLKEIVPEEAVDEKIPDSAKDFYSKGLDFAASDEPELAAAYFKRAGEENPKFSDTRFHLGKSYMEIGNYEDAAGAFKEVGRLEADYPFLHYELWEAYYKQENYSRALEAIQKSIEKMPDFTPSYRALAQTYRKLEKYENAAQVYEDLLEIIPKDEKALIQAVKNHLKAGNIEKSGEIHNDIKDKKPEIGEEIKSLINEFPSKENETGISK